MLQNIYKALGEISTFESVLDYIILWWSLWKFSYSLVMSPQYWLFTWYWKHPTKVNNICKIMHKVDVLAKIFKGILAMFQMLLFRIHSIEDFCEAFEGWANKKQTKKFEVRQNLHINTFLFALVCKIDYPYECRK